MSNNQRHNLVEQNESPNPYGDLDQPQLGKPYFPQQIKVPRNQLQGQGLNQPVYQNINPNLNQGYAPPQPQGNPYHYYQANQHPNQPGVLPNIGNVRQPESVEQKILIIQSGRNELNLQNLVVCRVCGYDGPSTIRKTAGCAVFMWCIFLFLFTGLFCWVPFCVQGCKNTQIVCSRCAAIKGESKGKCCC